MSFDDSSAECDQEIELIKDPEGIIAYPLKYKDNWYLSF